MKSFKEWCLENEKYEVLQLYENAENIYRSDEIGFSCSKEVNWKCTKCGMEWTASTNRMNRRKNNCVYCAHEKASPFYNLETEVPLLAKQWDYEKNEKNPTEYLPLSEEKVWWKCNEGHVWNGTICNRVKSVEKNINKGRPICPYCNHEKVSSTYNLVTEFPDVAKQWNYMMNGSLTPLEVSPKSNKIVWWTCEYDPTHVWKAKISARTGLNRGCKICSKIIKASFPEQALYYYLKLNFDNCEIGKEILDKYILDIFIPDYKIIIEYDGWYYHSDDASKKREEKKDESLAEFDIIRIKEVKEEMNEIICYDNILKYHPKSNYSNLSEVIKELLKLIEKKTNANLKCDVDCKRDHKQIQTMYYHTRKAKSLAVKRPELAKEWSSNNDRMPDNVTLGSSYRAKWICPKCSREYAAIVSNRVKQNTNCPFCANLKVCKENSLAYRFPQLLKEWNYEKNGDLLPEDVIAGSGKKVWWKCEKGHEWKTSVCARTGKKKVGCPHCGKTYVIKERSLEVKSPELKEIWNYEKNEGTPKDYFWSSNKKVWWKCSKGHEWQMALNKIHRIKSENKCPYCRNVKLSKDNSLAGLYKELSEEWNYELNEKV